MKRILTAAAVILLVAAGCGYIKEYPTSALELSVGGTDCTDNTVLSPYSGCFSFEDGTDRGFISDKFDSGYDISFDSAANSTDRAYKGTHSLKIACTYTGTVGSATASGIMKQGSAASPLNANFEGKKLTAYIWVPREMYLSTPDNPYGAQFFYKTMSADGWRWYQSEWVNVPSAPEGVAGVWMKMSADTNLMKTTAVAGHATGEYPPATFQIQAWGIKVGKGDFTCDYTGYIYMDSITAE
jgi:hypothetical protein